MSSKMFEDYADEFSYLRKMTLSLAKIIPEHLWDFCPHPDYGTFGRQLRHMVLVDDVFLGACKDGKMDFSRKRSPHNGSMSLQELLPAQDCQLGQSPV